MSLEYAIPLPGTSEHLDLQMGPLGSKKLTYRGRKVGGGFTSTVKLDVEGKQFKITQRSYFANSLPRVLIDKEEVKYFEPLPVEMTLIGILTKIAMILGIINGFLFLIPGLVSFHLQQYVYRKAGEDKSTALIVAGGSMILSWLIVLWGVYFWYNVLFN